jgi:hypothetical protein
VRENEEAEKRQDELNKRGYEDGEGGSPNKGSDTALNRTVRVLDRFHLISWKYRERWFLKRR